MPSLRSWLNYFIGSRPLAAPNGNASTSTTDTDGDDRVKDQSIANGTPRFSQSYTTSQPFKAAIIDVIRLRHYLLKASSHRLPIQLIDEILDHAEYWVHVSVSKPESLVARGNTAYSDVLVIRTPPICSLGTAGSEEDTLGLPEPTLQHPVRKIVFTIRSKDQGWSGEPRETKGTYRNSYTWFDAQIDKQFRPIPHDFGMIPWELSSTRFLNAWPDHRHQIDEEEESEEDRQANVAGSGVGAGGTTEAQPAGEPGNRTTAGDTEHTSPRIFSQAYLQTHRYEVQYNIQAQDQMREHRVEWRWTDETPEDGLEADGLAAIGRGRATGDGRFVRELRLGDCVSLWARARYPAWQNIVESALVEVYFAL